MKPKHKRLILILIGLAFLFIAVGLVLFATRAAGNLFYGPTEVAQNRVEDGVQFRIGGFVKKASLRKTADGLGARFQVTDYNKNIPVFYNVGRYGMLPDLFREGQGVVATGHMKNGTFVAVEILAKHDENYQPPESYEALKRVKKMRYADGQGA